MYGQERSMRNVSRLLSIVAALSMVCAMLMFAAAAVAEEGAPATDPEGIACHPVGGKFHDLDWDAQNWESGEPGLSGWTIKFKMEADPFTEYTTTTWSASQYGTAYLGQFEFPTTMLGSSTSPKVYTVSEVLKTGWKQTYPSANGGVYRIKYYGSQTYDLLAPSGYPKILNFGNAQLGAKGSIGNCVWHDDDRDGNGPAGCTKGPVFDNSEVVIPNVGVQLLIKTGANTVATVGQKTTGADGKYLFTDLDAANYIVDVLEPGVLTFFGGPFVKTTTEPYTYTLAQGENHLHADFGFDINPGPVYVGDWVWYDIDADGQQNEPSRAGIPCVEVRLWVGPDANTLTHIGTTNTDGWGNYAFPLLKPNVSGQRYFTNVSTTPEDPDVASYIVYYNGGSADHTCVLATEWVDSNYLYSSGGMSVLMQPATSPDGATTPTMKSTSLPTPGGYDLTLDYGFTTSPTAVSLQAFGASPLPAISVEAVLAVAGALMAGIWARRSRR